MLFRSRWEKVDSIKHFERFFNPELSLENMLQRIRDMISSLSPFMSKIIKFGVLTGLRASEVCESVKLLTCPRQLEHYYDKERQALEHFRFPEIFLRQTKKAYISFITKEQLSAIGILDCKTPLPKSQHATVYQSLSTPTYSNEHAPNPQDICFMAKKGRNSTRDCRPAAGKSVTIDID